MSGLGNFNLSSLSSMSTLGSLAQSAQAAQRLDRLMAGNNRSSRQQLDNSWNRNTSGRSMDDDFFGGRSGGSSTRRRSPSPPRRFNRDDRRSNDRRDRGNQRRNRDDSIYGSTSGAGILGAAPSGSDRPVSSGLGDMSSGTTWNESGNSLNKLNSQTQQLLNMMQTQQLLAAVQAQAKLVNQKPPSLMGPGYRHGARTMNQRAGWFNRNDRPRRTWEDRKRRVSPAPRPFKRERKDGESTTRRDQNVKKTTAQSGRDAARKDSTSKDSSSSSKDAKATKASQGKEKKMEVETKVSKNAAGEDVEALIKSNNDGKRYWCKLCKIVSMKAKNIEKHFMSDNHVKAVVEKQGKVFEPEIMKEQEVEKEKPKPKQISEFLKYVCKTKKTARKEKNDVFISSLTDCTVKISDFTSEQDFMGSEFVKTISGFKCQLCETFMRHGYQVLEHLQGKTHKRSYGDYLKDHPRYLENQRDVNKNLVEMLQKDEGKDVVLYETANDEVGDDGGHRHNDDGGHNDDGAEASSKLEENLEKDDDYNMDELDPTPVNSRHDDDSRMEEEPSVNDSAMTDEEDNEEDSLQVEETEGKVEKAEEKVEMEKEVEVEKEDEVEVKKEEMGELTVDLAKDFALDADEIEEEFPLLEPLNPTKDDPSEPEVAAKPEVEASTPEVEVKPQPQTAGEPAMEQEIEADDVTPTRRNTRKARRGRGGAKAGRGRTPTRRTPRGTKNVRKAEEVQNEKEEMERPAETEKEKEEEKEPGVPVAKMEEETSSQQKSTRGDVEGIDGFEVIDEVEGGDGNDDGDEDL